MNKFGVALEKFYRTMLLLFGVFEIALLWTMSVFFICYISSDTNEVTFFCKDRALFNILVVIVFIAFLHFLNKKKSIISFLNKLTDDKFFFKTKKIMLLIIAGLGLFWVIITQYVPGSDQLDVLSSAYKYGIGATDMVEAGGYLDRWPHNIGITTIERLFAYFVGDFNIIFMQLFNVLGIVLLYKKMVDIWGELGGPRFSQVSTLACGIIFYPLIMYASFVYGNIWHVTLAFIAFDAELAYLEEQKWRYILKAAFALGLSFLTKSSAIIFLVAMVIYAVVRGAKTKVRGYKLLFFILALCISVEAFSVVPKTILSKTTGYAIRNDGIWAFIAMGLQEDGPAPGWYNGYCLNVYYDNNRNTQLAEQIAREETISRIQYLFSDKHNSYEFFSKKIASMWIEPTYQGYWVNQVRYHLVVFPKWLDAFMSAKGYTFAARGFKIFQLLIFTGTLMWFVFGNKIDFSIKSFLLLCFVGGFTFNLMWEAKSQYAITYFIMLFPYAFEGYEKLLKRGGCINQVFNKLLLVYCSAVSILFLVGYRLDESNCLSKHNVEYSAYIEEWNIPSLSESVNDINNMKSWIKAYQDEEKYFKKILDENGIVY